MVTCLRCGAYDDRYCGCWQDRAPGYDLGFGPFGRIDIFTVLSPTFLEKNNNLPHATPILPNLDVRGHDTIRIGLEIKEGTGTSVPVLASARRAHTLYEGGGWV